MELNIYLAIIFVTFTCQKLTLNKATFKTAHSCFILFILTVDLKKTYKERFFCLFVFFCIVNVKDSWIGSEEIQL